MPTRLPQVVLGYARFSFVTATTICGRSSAALQGTDVARFELLSPSEVVDRYALYATSPG